MLRVRFSSRVQNNIFLLSFQSNWSHQAEIKSLKAASSLPSVPSVDEGKPLRTYILTSRNYKLLKIINIWKQSIHFRVQLYSWHVKTIQNSNTLWRANINLAAIKKLLSTIKCLVCGGPHAAVCNTCDFCFLHVSEVRTKVSLISDGLRLLPLGGRTSSLRPSDSWAKTEVGQKI